MVIFASALDPGEFDHMSGFGRGMLGIGLVVGLTLIGVLAWTLVQATPRHSGNGSTVTSSAKAILADRFARGRRIPEPCRRAPRITISVNGQVKPTSPHPHNGGDASIRPSGRSAAERLRELAILR